MKKAKPVDSCLLDLHVQPGARRSEVAGMHGERIKVRVAARAVDGAANAALVELLARELGVPKSRVEIVAGHSARAKRVRVTGMTGEAAAGLLLGRGDRG
jgi:uncharacterized protein (TIGR00251 family)